MVHDMQSYDREACSQFHFNLYQWGRPKTTFGQENILRRWQENDKLFHWQTWNTKNCSRLDQGMWVPWINIQIPLKVFHHTVCRYWVGCGHTLIMHCKSNFELAPTSQFSRRATKFVMWVKDEANKSPSSSPRFLQYIYFSILKLIIIFKESRKTCKNKHFYGSISGKTEDTWTWEKWG